MGWSTSAPSGITWGSWVDGSEASHVNNYYNYWIRSRIGRGANNAIAVQVQLWVYGYNYDVRTQYPNVGIELKAQVSVGNTSSYSSSSVYTCAGAYVTRTNSKTLYYTGTAAKGQAVYARCAWTSHYTGATKHTAPEYTTRHTVSYNSNNGSGATASQSKLYGSTVSLYGCSWTRTGYAFTKWNTKADGSGTSYSAGASYSANANLTLYAQWAPNTYAVSYSANGGTGTTEAQTKTYGEALTLRECGYEKEGHSFTRWNTKADGSGTSYAEGASYTANAAVTLYAQWTPNTYPVTYDGNGGTGTTEKQTKTWGVTLILRECGFARKGWAFTGWNTEPDGTGTSYAAGGSYTANEAATLYAQWVKLNIPVFVNDGGTVRQAEKAYVNDGGTVKECAVYLNDGGTIRRIE